MTIVSTPGLRSYYPSVGHRYWDGHFEGCGPWHAWCIELGYPNVDIQQWQDGEWALIEFYQAPIIPSMTRWNFILQGMRNVEIGPGFVTKYIKQLDLHQKEAWAIAEAKTAAMEEEKVRLDKHAEDTAEKAKNIILQTPTLVERIAEKGLPEMDLDKIVKHIPRHQLNGLPGIELK